MKMRYLLFALVPVVALAQSDGEALPDGWAGDPPAIESLVSFARAESDLRVAITRYVFDQAAIERRYEVQYSPARIERLREFTLGWQKQLSAVDFEALNQEGQIDYILLRNRLRYDLEMLGQQETRRVEIAPLIPFFDELRLLQESRHDRERGDPRAVAGRLDSIAEHLDGLIGDLPDVADQRSRVSPVVAWRASNQLDHIRQVLADWNTFYSGYDPMFNFWVPEPYGRVDEGLGAYAEAIRWHLVGITEDDKAPIIGDPVLADGLRADLAVEMIPYSARELLEIGEKEFAWIEEQFRDVSRRMGFGDDWKAALEHTKNLAPAPGEKPWVIFEIADYSENYVEGMGNITMPPLAREVWRLRMQTPEDQLRSPFFTGGEETRVSYPTNTMAHRDKLMSMRGNTPHFNFGTVQHELLPGHHMQGFLTQRFNPHRGYLSWTPFWSEGWAFYWEFRLWDSDFPRSDEDRIGMLFWRLHRAARIVFSLNYHLGNWTPQEAVDFLVDRVGHERANAEAEVRRTTIDAPLYQIAYMMGALQFRALYEDLVVNGDMDERAFHDAVMQGGTLPVELVRARLTGQALSPDFESGWRFYRDP